MSRSLVVVRGAYRGTDPTYACVAHNTNPSNYCLLDIENGRVVQRAVVPAANRRTVEEAMAKSDTYRGGVYVDARADRGLLPLTTPAHAREADLASFRRAKSDEELEALESLHAAAVRLIDDSEKSGKGGFRGAAHTEGHKHAYHVTRKAGFTQYRGGLQDELGRCSEATRVVPKTEAWEARLARAERGFRAVESAIRPGAKVRDLNQAFLEHMDPEKDAVYGSVVRHVGQTSHEEEIPLEGVEAYDFLGVGAAVGELDGAREVALVYRNAKAVRPEAEADGYRGSAGLFGMGGSDKDEEISLLKSQLNRSEETISRMQVMMDAMQESKEAVEGALFAAPPPAEVMIPACEAALMYVPPSADDL